MYSRLLQCRWVCYFRPHYFILLIPAIALLTGRGVSSLAHLLMTKTNKRVIAALPALVLVGSCAYAINLQSNIFFSQSPSQVCRTIYGGDAFPESVIVADYIREHSKPSDRIAVLGSEPQIYFYSQRESATGYIYTYGMLEKQDLALKMQHEMMAEITRVGPKFVVLVCAPGSWIRHPGSPGAIFDWMERYVDSGYHFMGLVDVMQVPLTQGVWGADAEVASPMGGNYVLLYQRKGK